MQSHSFDWTTNDIIKDAGQGWNGPGGKTGLGIIFQQNQKLV